LQLDGEHSEGDRRDEANIRIRGRFTGSNGATGFAQSNLEFFVGHFLDGKSFQAGGQLGVDAL
jgi:hypothetical protein